MCSGTGLSDFSEKYPDRFFDVGIAEGNAVSMAAGMAKEGLTPVFAVYSTFLQRSYDMLIHDIALSHLHAVFAVDRAGIVGSDGETHQGLFDVSYLCSVPQMAVLAPSSYKELRDMLELAVHRVHGPVAVRYPRGGEGVYTKSAGTLPVSILKEGSDITIVSYGILINEVLKAYDELKGLGISPEIIKINLLNPLDTKPIMDSLIKTRRLLVVEDVCSAGSVGSRIMSQVALENIELLNSKLLDLGNGILTHGSVKELQHMMGIDCDGIVKSAKELVLDSSEDNADKKETN